MAEHTQDEATRVAEAEKIARTYERVGNTFEAGVIRAHALAARFDGGEADEREALEPRNEPANLADEFDQYATLDSSPGPNRWVSVPEHRLHAVTATLRALARLRVVGRDAEPDDGFALAATLQTIRNDDDKVGLIREGDPYGTLVVTIGQLRAALRASGARGQEETKT